MVEKSTAVSRNSLKLILPSPSLSTILNIFFTNTSEGFMPRAARKRERERKGAPASNVKH